MELIFNELSVQPIADDKTEAFKRVYSFLQTYQKASEFGFNRIRFADTFDQIELSSGYTLENFCNEPTNRTRGTLLRGLKKYPFIDDDTEEENQYIENSFFILKDEVRYVVYGLAAAYLYSTLCIAFRSEKFWDNFKYELIVRKELQERIEIVGCISSSEHTGQNDFQEWLAINADVYLVETDMAIEEKQISLADHHGKDVLKEFAKKIIKSEYVVGIINSLPYNPRERRFVKKIHPDGKIEIVLTWTNSGYGMIIETTGRNWRETKRIAEILSHEYSDS